jgi:hypothetical protein
LPGKVHENHSRKWGVGRAGWRNRNFLESW